MGSWNGTKIGLKVKESEEELANEFLMLLGLKLSDDMDEEIGELSDLEDYTVVGTVQDDLLGIMPSLEKKFVDYQNQFYGPDEEDEVAKDDNHSGTGIRLDDLFLVVKKLFPRSGMYLAHEDGNSVSDAYYRYEVIYSATKKTEINCYYCYGDGINVETDCPEEEGTEKTEERLTAKKPDNAVIELLIKKAESEGYDELVRRLQGKTADADSSANVKKNPPIKKIPGLKIVRGIVAKYTGDKTKIEIPEGVIEIGNEAFAYSDLKSITLPDTLVHIGEKAFWGCSYLKEIKIPANVINIGTEAFLRCSGLREIVIPEGIIRIERSTFDNCTKLQKITLPSTLKEIGERAFYWCRELTDLELPDGIEAIGDKAFYDCENLKEPVLPQSLKKIGSEAFAGCKSIEKLVIPNSVMALGAEIANGMKIYVSSLDFLLKLKECRGPFGSQTKYREEYCTKLFVDGVLLEELVIPDGVSEICGFFMKGYRFLKSVIIPESVTSIGLNAFAYCYGLKKAVVPKALEQMIKDNKVFRDCEELTEIQYV